MSRDEGTDITVDQVLWEHRASDLGQGVKVCVLVHVRVLLYVCTQKTDNIITGTIILETHVHYRICALCIHVYMYTYIYT